MTEFSSESSEDFNYKVQSDNESFNNDKYE